MVILLGFITGCQLQPTQQSTVIHDWQRHEQQLSALQQWSLEGKLGYRDSNDGGSAWVDWWQHQRQFKLYLRGPLGTGATHIHGDENYAELQQSDKPPISATSASDLTLQLFGWRWPVDHLQYWVKGLPAPMSSVNQFAYHPNGALASLNQADWQLSFNNYETVDGFLLPTRIKGQREGYYFKLVIKKWQLKGVSP